MHRGKVQAYISIKQQEKKEVLLSFPMSPTRWKKEDGVQGRQKEELGLMVGCWHTDCTLFLRVREEF